MQTRWKALATAAVVAALVWTSDGDASAAPAGAGTALAWIETGAQPCAELCDARWALDRMREIMPHDVHHELVRRIDAGLPMTDHRVTRGDVIAAVSYARAGIPLVDLTRRLADFPPGVEFPARGHVVMHDGLAYRFLRVESWNNWALILDDEHPVPQFGQRNRPFRVGITAGRGGARAAGGSALSLGVDASYLLRPPPPMPIPLPGGFVLLAGALTVLAAPRLCRAWRRR